MINNIVSIIIPVYNGEKFISQNFNCCLKLSEKFNIKIIYVDNNSSDNSFSILKKKIRNKNNFFLFKTKKKDINSPGIARNIAVTKSKSKFILFLDIDDLINISNFKKLIKYLEKTSVNLIYLGKLSENNKSSPYKKYNIKSLNKFFKYSNNMEVIGLVFNKNFLKKFKLKFSNGIFEDIFFIFKCHFYNSKKIFYFKRIIYIKKFHKNSITNSVISKKHIFFKLKAWKSIYFFLKRKLSKNKFNKIDNFIQYRLRGEFCNQYNQIIKSELSSIKKNILIDYTVRSYKKITNKFYKNLTHKDKLAMKILYNV
jgi:glycosyltransferase involved in cell wall biosynthesis